MKDARSRIRLAPPLILTGSPAVAGVGASTGASSPVIFETYSPLRRSAAVASATLAASMVAVISRPLRS